MDCPTQEITNDDTGSPERFSWYHEDTNGNFNLRYANNRNSLGFEGVDIPPVPVEKSVFTSAKDLNGERSSSNKETSHHSLVQQLHHLRDAAESSSVNDTERGDVEDLASSRKPTDEERVSSYEHDNIQAKIGVLESSENEELSPCFSSSPTTPINYFKRRKTASGSISVGESAEPAEYYHKHHSLPFDSATPEKRNLEATVSAEISFSNLENGANLLERVVRENGLPLISSEFSLHLPPTIQSQNDQQHDLLNTPDSSHFPSADSNGETVEGGNGSSFPSVSDHVEPGFLQSLAAILNTQIPSPPPSLHGRRRSSSISSLASISPVLLKPPLNQFSCLERKRILISPDRPHTLTSAMKLWLEKTQSLLNPFRSASECWFHPFPPPPRSRPNGTLCPYGKIAKAFTWTDQHGKHSLVLNYGICAKLVSDSMTKQQSDGWVQRQWHLSHLCGNWSCVNPQHTTVEKGATNVGRNNCFSHRDGCGHLPKCLKELKSALGADGKLVPRGDGVEERIRKTYHWEDWWGWDGVLERIKNGDRKVGEEWEDYPLLVDDDDDNANDWEEEQVAFASTAVEWDP